LSTPTPTSDTYTLSLHYALPISAIACIDQRKGDVLQRRSAWQQVECLKYKPDLFVSYDRQLILCHLAYELVVQSVRSAGRCIKRSEEHTSELQSRSDLVCRLLLE